MRDHGGTRPARTTAALLLADIPADAVSFQGARQERQRVAVEHHPNQHEKYAARHGDAVHVPFDLFKVIQEGINRKGGDKQGKPDAHRVTREQLDTGQHGIGRAGIQENGPQDRADTGRPTRSERDADEERPNIAGRAAGEVNAFVGHQKFQLQLAHLIDPKDDDENSGLFQDEVLLCK